MGKERYWNKLRCKKKKKPKPHEVCSISIPKHIIKRTDWEKDDLIGFQLYKGYAKSRYSIELRNLSKEKEPYASLVFLQLEEQYKNFLKKITARNRGNFSKDMQKIFTEQRKKKIKKREKETNEKTKESEKKLEKMVLEALKKEIKQKKETNKERLKQAREGHKRRVELTKQFLDDDLKELEERLKKCSKTLQKHPITSKPTEKHNK